MDTPDKSNDAPDLSGRIVLLSGGTGGIGKKIARRLLDLESTVLLLGSTITSAERARRELICAAGERVYERLYPIACDITSEEVVALSEALLVKGHSPNALVNAAAVIGPQEPFADADFNEWYGAVETNLVGNARLLHAFIPILQRSGLRPKIINFSGGGSVGVRRYHSAYASSKAAMVNLTEQLAAEYPSMDINILAPGVHNTRMVEEERHERPTAFADDERFLACVEYLLSPASDGISGNFIHYTDDLSPLKHGHRLVVRRIELDSLGDYVRKR